MAKACITKHNGSPAICVDGQFMPPMTATVVTCRTPLGETGRTIDVDYYKALGDAGIKIFYIMCNNLEADPNGVKDFAEEARLLFSAVPDAYVMVRMVLNPTKKWMDENPGEILRFNDGSTVPALIRTESMIVESDGMFVLYSDKWRQDYGKVLERTLAEIEKLPFADRIIGFFLGAGLNAEWFHTAPFQLEDGRYGDFSEAFRKECAEYLQEYYGEGEENIQIPEINDCFYLSKLDSAVNNPGRILASWPAPVPPQVGSNHGTFLNIETHRHTFDFYRVAGLATAKSIIHFAKIVKNHCPDLLTGSFYGAIGMGVSSGGVNQILRSGCVDFLANPGNYENRQPGGFTGQRQAYDSHRLHNAMFITEDDTRTHAENELFSDWYDVFTPEDTVNILKREFGRNIGDDLQSWWYDQHIGGGRYKFPEVYQLFARQQEIAKTAYSLDRGKGHEVAIICDEESCCVTNGQTLADTIGYFFNYEVSRLGLGADIYFHNDMSHPDMPDYKLYVFLNCLYLNDKERAEIRTKLKKNHAVALFLYGSGYFNPDRDKKMSVDNMEDLTGIRCVEKMKKSTPKFKVFGDHPIAQGLDQGKQYGDYDIKRMPNQKFVPDAFQRSYLFPVLCAQDCGATDIAYFVQNGLPAVSVKEADGFTSVYYGAKVLTAEVVREMARFAKCHIYDEDTHVLFVNQNFLTVHASHSGKITLKFPQKCSPYELYEEKYYGENVAEISFDLLKGETRMFQLRRS